LFYVYILRDPRNNEPFYVGKGTGPRIEAHEKEMRRGVSSPKCNRIREIVESGQRVIKERVAEFALEADAYRHEAQLIAKYGACLTNGGRIVMPDHAERAYWRMLAVTLKAKAGCYANRQGRYLQALLRALLERADEIIAKAVAKYGRERVVAEVRRYGVVVNGR